MANSAPGAHRAGRTLGTSAAPESYIDFLKMVFGVAGGGQQQNGGWEESPNECVLHKQRLCDALGNC